MHTEIFKNIDLLIEMAGSTLDVQDILADLTQINKEIQDKKQRLEDLKGMMNDTRYFNASNELVDKNIEVSLKLKITRLNKKIKEVCLELNNMQNEEDKLNKDISALQEKQEENKKYISMLDGKVQSDDTDAYKTIVDNEKEHMKELESILEQNIKKHDDILKEIELHKQAKEELVSKKDGLEVRLKEIEDSLNNPNSYIDEDLKKQDEEELQYLNDALDNLQKRKLEYLTDANMVGADAKELVVNNNYPEALEKIKELLDIVKSKPYMDITNLSVLDEELEKKEGERTELANYIDTKDYSGMSSDEVGKRINYLTEETTKENEEVSRYEDTIKQINQDIHNNLSVLIKDIETEITNTVNELLEYQELVKDSSKSRRTKANLENAILKKEKEKNVLEDMLSNYKKDLLFKITVSNAIVKMVAKYKQNIEEKAKEIEELKRLEVIDEVTKDYILEEKDKEKLKSINDEIKQIKNRQKYDKTPDEVYDQIEMLLGTQNTTTPLEDTKEEEMIDEVIDELFLDEDKSNEMLKVVEMIPAHTVQSDGGSYGA